MRINYSKDAVNQVEAALEERRADRVATIEEHLERKAKSRQEREAARQAARSEKKALIQRARDLDAFAAEACKALEEKDTAYHTTKKRSLDSAVRAHKEAMRQANEARAKLNKLEAEEKWLLERVEKLEAQLETHDAEREKLVEAIKKDWTEANELWNKLGTKIKKKERDRAHKNAVKAVVSSFDKA